MKMYHIIVNPESRSGHGIKNWEKIKTVFDNHNARYEVHFTNGAGDATALVRQLSETCLNNNEKPHFVILGGDGTLNEALQGFVSFLDITLSVIPMGSSNDFIRGLEINPDPVQIATHILERPTSLFTDVGVIHLENSSSDSQTPIPERRFIVSTGAGYDAAICAEANASNTKKLLNRLGLGKLCYLLICLKQLFNLKGISAQLTLEDSDEIITLNKLLFVAGMNTKYEGGGFMFAPEASQHDGLLDLCVVSELSKFTIIRALPQAAKGNHFKFDGIDFYRTPSYTLRTSSPVWIHTDGETDYQADFISVKIMKEALHLVY